MACGYCRPDRPVQAAPGRALARPDCSPAAAAAGRVNLARPARVRYTAAMDAAEFHRAVDAAIERVVRALQDAEDVDFTAGDGLLTLEFEDGARWVLNRQSGNHQLWLAAGARAWHYGWDAATASWRDDRDGHEVWERLRELLAAKLGRPVAI
jgi:CyaY protein